MDNKHLRKSRFPKSYLAIPVFLGMLALTGQVSADEIEVLVVEELRTQVDPVAVEVVEPQELTEEVTSLEAEEVVVETAIATEDSVEEVVAEQSTDEETEFPEQTETVTEAPTVETKPASPLAHAVPEVAEEISAEVLTESSNQSPVLGLTDSGEVVDTYLAGAASSVLVSYQLNSTGVSIRYEHQIPVNTEILHAVWSDKSGQDDLKWYVSDAAGAAYAEFKNHKDYGRYHLHTYARTNGQMKGLLAQTFDRTAPAATEAQEVAKVSHNGNYYTVQGKYGEIVLVNKQHPVNASYAPGENAEAKQAFNNLKTAMQSQGYAISNNYSGYRSYQHQANLYNNYVAQHGQAQADRFSARPGYSEHQTGLAYDLLSSNGSLVNDSRAVNWIKTNAHRYGFIVRYPEGKESITGYMYEPWHLRYIGKEATDIYQSGQTLEEYFDVKGGTTYGVASYGTLPSTATTSQEGVHTFTVRTAVKSEPTAASPVLATYEPGQTVRYDSRVTNDGYEWLSYINYSGSRSYVAVKRASSSVQTPTTPAQSTTSVTKKTNAKVEVVGYDEYKTNFTVKVTGQSDTENISKVSVAVWSQDKGQDDLKWYTPSVTNNQSTVTVDIKDHSNTSDKYIVHVYTTYANGQTVGSNLGSFQITKEKPVTPSVQSTTPVTKKTNAKVEVVGYEASKTNFTVKVTGQSDTENISKVAVAVWSQDKGQDDLKWYTPSVINNQSTVTVDIKDHSNTSDKYIVHVYTTYANGQTVGTNLGSFQITKEKPVTPPVQSTTPVTKKTNAKVEVIGYEASKTNFTVKVTGQSDTENISKVAVAVWSQDKGQDDLKWYTPSVINNQSTVTVDIKDHSNTSDKYIVHVYTTYANGQTVGTNVGTYQINKPAYTEHNKSHAGKTFRVLGNHNPSNAIMNAVVNAINEVERQGYSLGFKLTDAKTGEGISYNANTKFYSASTIKAPYVAALAANRPATINNEYYNMKAIAEWSSNEGYAYLRNTYGAAPIYNWADKSGVSRTAIDPLYPYLTPTELHALWKTNYEYFNGSANGRQVAALFTNPNLSPIKATVGATTKTQSKAGWIAGWGYHAANDGGIVYTNKGDYVLSVMSNADGKVGLLNSLVRSLNNLYQGMK